MSTINLTHDNFKETVSQFGVTIVDFWANWCEPCKAFAPVFEEASNKNPEVTFAKVDTEEEELLATTMGISAIPTIMIYRDGILFFNEPGALPAKNLEKLVELVQKIDMAQVRSEMALQDAGGI